MSIRQQEIDELLMSSDEEGEKVKKSKKKDKKQLKKQQINDDEYDDFFQSQITGQQKPNTNNKQLSSKTPSQPSKGVKQSSLKSKQLPQPKKQSAQNKQQSHLFEQQYMNSNDFQSLQQQSLQQQVSVVQKQSHENNENSIEEEDVYEVRGEEQVISHESELVESVYTQSRIREEEDEMREELETVRSSRVDSRVVDDQDGNGNGKGDDQLSMAQSEYMESDNFDAKNIVKKHDFKKKEGMVNHGGKKTDLPKVMGKKDNKVGGISNQPKRQLIKPKQPVKKQAAVSSTNNNKTQGKKVIQKQQVQQPKSAKSINPDKKQLTQSELKQQQQQHKSKLAQIQAQRDELKARNNAKLNEQKQRAKKEYEQMKKKQQQRKELNKKVLQQQRAGKKTQNLVTPNTQNERKQLQLTQSKIKQINEQQTKKKSDKAQMKTAVQMKQKRKREQEQVRMKLQSGNIEKMKKLQQQKQGYFDRTVRDKNQYAERKKVALAEKKDARRNVVEQKKNQKKQLEAPQLRKIKQEVGVVKTQIQQRQQAVLELDEEIKKLKKALLSCQCEELNMLPQKRSKIEAWVDDDDDGLQSEMTSLEKFVQLFGEVGGSAGQIFKLIDEDGDQMVSLEEVKKKVMSLMMVKWQQARWDDGDENMLQSAHQQLSTDPRMLELVTDIFTLLDKNSDGNVTKQQFAFIIETQLKKTKEYRSIMRNIKFRNPIDIQAQILDMKEKMKFMQRQQEKEMGNQENRKLQQKYEKYLLRSEENERKIVQKKSKEHKAVSDDKSGDINQQLKTDKLYFLRQQSVKLRTKKQSELVMLQKIRARQQQNIKQKNIELSQKVQQNIMISEEIYKLQREIQEMQLRFLSKQKIIQNRHRYASQQSKQKAASEEAMYKAKQYQMRILNPGKAIRAESYANQVMYLAAVVMIQRNFRKKQAKKRVEMMKAGE